jgi:cysteinyl-tRNA synthetase
MSKSLGNFTTIRDLLDKVDPMAVRMFTLQAHYRKPLDFAAEALEAATHGWHTLKDGLLFGHSYGEQLGWTLDGTYRVDASIAERFQNAVDDDFNFAGGLAVLFEVAKELRKEGNLLTHEGKTEVAPEGLEKQWHTLVELAQVLGLEAQPAVKEETSDSLSDPEIEKRVQQRTEARKNKDFATSDHIRDELADQGIILVDKPGGVTTWHRG